MTDADRLAALLAEIDDDWFDSRKDGSYSEYAAARLIAAGVTLAPQPDSAPPFGPHEPKWYADAGEWCCTPHGKRESPASDITTRHDLALADQAATIATLRAALERIQDICKPLSVGMDGPHWMANPLVGGGSKESIWRICDAALVTAKEADHDAS